MRQIPCFKHPTTLLFIDDNSVFLEALSKQLSFANHRFILSDNPEEALAILEASPAMPMSMDLRSFSEMVYHPGRFNMVSGIVADYEMPEMNGLELCEHVETPVSKILLTGVAAELIAINAFNQKLIDRYVSKNDIIDIKMLDAVIEDAEQDYFERITKFYHHLILHGERETTLVDPVFIEFFWKTSKSLEAIEHYLLDPVGNFLFLNRHGQCSTLYTYNEGLLRHVSESEEAKELPANLRRDLASGTQILCWRGTSESPFLPGHLWSQHIRPACKIQGKQSYYCAVTPESMSVDVNRIVSFQP